MGVLAGEVDEQATDSRRGAFFYQYLATVSGCLSIICTGMHFGWPSPSLPQLIHENSSIAVTHDEGSWLAAMPCIGAASGSIIAAVIVDKIGRKTSMLLTSPLYFVTWIMVAYSPSVMLLYIARFLVGTSDGVAFTVFPMYLGEIANAKIRGMLGSSVQVSMFIGMLLINSIGSFLDITYTALISAGVPILHFVTFCFMPESPYYLVMKENLKEAEKSLKKLYRSKDVTDELNEVIESVKEDKANDGKFWELFTIKSNRKAVFIVFGLRAFQQLSGTNVITFYAGTIFKEAGSDVPSSISTIVYFSVQLVVSIIASFLVDKLGRKPLLIWSIIGSGAALAMEGVYVYLDDYTDVDMSHLKCVPLVALIGYVTVFNIGMGTIPVLLLGEMFPTSVKAVALCLADIFFGVIVTIISKFFQFTKDSMGLHVPFFVFTASCVLGLLFIIIWVPETKGKTLEEIQHELKGGKKKSAKVDNS
ncbi:unnamed protein product [Callosobruchus maculatus]|uniref:Major facilitator superfamily (MFS) profile domain-containing protein n=1 Tax=Callosobruchus maculatus TaxID=64391 RepID=A0A653C9S0_CALMS|nr:unnamed protein product [Callosobruchus maculatus]